MADEQNAEIDQAELLKTLKARADVMGITYSNRIGVDALRAKINAKMEGEDQPVDETDADLGEQPDPEAEVTEEAPLLTDPQTGVTPPATPEIAAENAQPNPGPVPTAPNTPAPKPKSKAEQMQDLRTQLIAEQMKLVRCRITNLDPKKANLPGEIFTVANEFLGTVKRFVPYGEVTDEGYHIPFCIYTQLQERKFLNIRTKKEKGTGHISTSTGWVKEFAIEVLEPLTEDELKQLAAAQAAAGSIESGLE